MSFQGSAMKTLLTIFTSAFLLFSSLSFDSLSSTVGGLYVDDGTYKEVLSGKRNILSNFSWAAAH